ncbi:hypothetical protein CCHR01_01380 [Colletotrichum chrysophilum]|uniref:Uncharacterized protein n=1 Tax=Colletotrichum chrysophilum TaxID=1836956 RepID=A0AAD9AWP2_9PEZI|nr:hypothetical protein CCHR01_01380 [Colletotrichum chrysophilum]
MPATLRPLAALELHTRLAPTELPPIRRKGRERLPPPVIMGPTESNVSAQRSDGSTRAIDWLRPAPLIPARHRLR